MLLELFVAEEEDPMGAHSKKIDSPRCRSCDARASVEVFDVLGRSRGCYCGRCGRAKFEALQRQERKAAP